MAKNKKIRKITPKRNQISNTPVANRKYKDTVFRMLFVYFDCAEPTARMLRASLAEDESHLHGRLSQVKFDNTSVC